MTIMKRKQADEKRWELKTKKHYKQ